MRRRGDASTQRTGSSSFAGEHDACEDEEVLRPLVRAKGGKPNCDDPTPSLSGDRVHAHRSDGRVALHPPENHPLSRLPRLDRRTRRPDPTVRTVADVAKAVKHRGTRRVPLVVRIRGGSSPRARLRASRAAGRGRGCGRRSRPPQPWSMPEAGFTLDARGRCMMTTPSTTTRAVSPACRSLFFVTRGEHCRADLAARELVAGADAERWPPPSVERLAEGDRSALSDREGRSRRARGPSPIADADMFGEERVRVENPRTGCFDRGLSEADEVPAAGRNHSSTRGSSCADPRSPSCPSWRSCVPRCPRSPRKAVVVDAGVGCRRDLLRPGRRPAGLGPADGRRC